MPCSHVDIGDGALAIHFGHSEERIPLADVKDAARVEWSTIFYGLGVRMGPDGLAYVGCSTDVVFVPLAKAHALRVLFQHRHDFSGVYFSLEDPEAFIAALQAARG